MGKRGVKKGEGKWYPRIICERCGVHHITGCPKKLPPKGFARWKMKETRGRKKGYKMPKKKDNYDVLMDLLREREDKLF